MAKTAWKSFSLSSSSQKLPLLLFWCMLCTATPDHSSSSENINNTPGFPDYLSVSYDYTKTYCKVSHVLKSVKVIRKSDRKLLQSGTDTTECDRYYKVWQKIITRYKKKFLQSVTIITKLAPTGSFTLKIKLRKTGNFSSFYKYVPIRFNVSFYVLIIKNWSKINTWFRFWLKVKEFQLTKSIGTNED